MNKHIRKQMTDCTKNDINKETNQRTKIDAKERETGWDEEGNEWRERRKKRR